MTPLLRIKKIEAAITVSGVPDGVQPQLLAELVQTLDEPVLFVARDDARAHALIDELQFFAPDLAPLYFPAWDCLPYDRVSPNHTLVAERMAVLSELTHGACPLLITTINAVTQRVPPKALLEEGMLVARPGDHLERETLISFLEKNGYARASTVMEPGDFAVRGSLIDLFAPGHEHPLRLDFFGDELESVRAFDGLTQRTLHDAGALELMPVTEFLLDAETISRFRQGYVARFGAVTDDDPLYEAVSAGRRHQGMEHWLPLFHDRLSTLSEYLPGARLVLDHLAEEARGERMETIADYFEARQEFDAEGTQFSGPAYKPLPPDALYLTDDEWTALIDAHGLVRFTPFGEPDSARSVNYGGKLGRNFAPERTQPDRNVYEALKSHLGDLLKAGKRPLIASFSEGSRDRLGQILRDSKIEPLALVDNLTDALGQPAGTIGLGVLPLEHGVEWDSVAIISEQDVLGDRMIRRAQKRRKAEDFISDAASLSVGDLVVHSDHGIGRYGGLFTIEAGGAPHDCLLVTYHNDDKLYLPVENIELLSRYGGDSELVELDRLGGTAWQSRKARLKKKLLEMAEELIRIAAARELKHAAELGLPEGAYDEFCARFPYHETDDQARAIADVIEDLASGRPMDRLVCGDVGFGKTEVALRSAFVAAMAGKQVAIVVPTTLLARQHTKNVTERMKGFPLRIGQLSRLVSQKDAALTKNEMEEGKIDIVIGTHALLQKSIKFRDLGLLIVDEEQHFGVKHKERLKEMKADVHVLTLTATPIPRTLQLAMTGVRDLSIIATPPVDRLAVRTFVMPFDPVVAREAILREHYRGGQTFYVAPRIADLPELQEFLETHVPEVRVAVAHGQMAPGELDQIMTAFYDGHFDVLLSTTIVESGLDIPTANTMLVHRADMFGLAQLYQLRGRIGRSKTRAYAYLTVPQNKSLTDGAEKRLKVLQSLDTLGAGFTLASHDLDLRGAGNLLGEEQSGHIREVGFELYREMLEDAIASLREGGGADVDDGWSPQINIGAAVLIPENYVPDLNVRLSLYRRLSSVDGSEEMDGFAAELIDRFGPLPEEVDFLMKIVAIKQLCRKAGVAKLDAGPKGATVGFRKDEFANPAGLVEFVQNSVGTVKLRPDMTLVYMRGWSDVEARLKGAHNLVQKLAKLADSA